MKVKTYLCGATIILENGELLDDPLFRRLFFVTVPADDNLINEEKNACHSAIEDTLICYADRYGPPAPGVRVVPHLVSVTEMGMGVFTLLADKLGF